MKSDFEVLLWFENHNYLTVKQIKEMYCGKDISWDVAEPILQRLTNDLHWLAFSENKKGIKELNEFYITRDGIEMTDKHLNRAIIRNNLKMFPINRNHVIFAIALQIIQIGAIVAMLIRQPTTESLLQLIGQ